MSQNDNRAKEIKQSFEKILGTDLILKRKKKNNDDIRREAFEKLIFNLERLNVRSNILVNDFNLDLAKYDDLFYEVIDTLIFNTFGKDAAEIIFFYIYERLNPDGTVSNFEIKDAQGNILPLNNPTDLWNIVCNLIK